MTDHKRRPWTDDEHARMVAMLRQGKSQKEIADALGRAPGSVSSRANATDSQGVYHGTTTFQPWTAEMKAMAHRMYDAGDPIDAIAAVIGRTAVSVPKHFNAIDAKPKSPATGPRAKALRECIPCKAAGKKTVFLSDHAGVRICQRCRDRIARSNGF